MAGFEDYDKPPNVTKVQIVKQLTQFEHASEEDKSSYWLSLSISKFK